MRNYAINLGLLTIEIGALVSNIMDFRKKNFAGLRGIQIFSPAATPGGTITVETTGNLDAETPELVIWCTQKSGGADLTLAALEALPIDFVCWQGLRVASSAAESVALVYIVKGVEE